MTKVVVKNGDFDSALKKFSAKFARSGVPSELKKRKHYEKPGVRRRNEIKEGIKNSHKRHKGNRG
ncbi:MAG TPA: 30S ribosomal protein S21 [Candidatus Onthocola stercorigallinarum]|jgi:small subunit ribosomal protein S21|nr:30S ribosomal protein S21 [Candidatus Onthocola stercorigallinarum]